MLLIALLGACGNPADQVPEVAAPPTDRPLFEMVPGKESGITWANMVPETERMNVLIYENFYSGGGVSVGDLTGDGLPELFFVGNTVGNALYLNKGGLRFEDITEKAGVKGSGRWGKGSVMVDVDADGDLDIYVCNAGLYGEEKRRNELFVNNGDGTFTEDAARFGLDDPGYSTQAAFFDMDLDGDLDMYLLNYGIQKQFSNVDVSSLKHRPDPYGGDKLFRNDDGRFVEVGAASGISNSLLGNGLGVAVGHLNDDLYPDLYVCNDFFERDYLYINNGDGTFTDKLIEQVRHISNFSMGVDIADMNNDGLLDIMVADMVAEDNFRQKANMSGMDPDRFWATVDAGFHYQYMVNTLQLNNGNGSFSEIGHLAGVSNTDWSWAPLFADLDLDGRQDLFVTNGLRKDVRNNDFNKKVKAFYATHDANRDPQGFWRGLGELLPQMPSQRIPNYVFRNAGHLRMEKVMEEWGLGEPTFSNGAVYADLDADGDLDLVTNNVDQPAFIFRNNAHARHWLTVAMAGGAGGPFGIGVRVEARVDGRSMVRENNPTRGYQSSVEPLVHFGLGDAGSIDTLRVIWPDGRMQVMMDVTGDLTVRHADATGTWRPASRPPTWFVEADAAPDFRHRENDFDDFEREVLLPHQLSRFGPALAVADVDGDGLEDAYLGGASGQAGALFLQRNGRFQRQAGPFDRDRDHEDVDALFLDADGDGDPDLYVVSGGNEFAPDDERLRDRLYINDGRGGFRRATEGMPDLRTSGGCAAAADMDGDGDTDLFVGGRVVPGQYPVAPRSHLLRNDGGRFTEVTAELAPALERPGLVTDAAWTDIDGDGRPDLVVVGEWMPVLVMRNDGSTLSDIGTDLGLARSNGWWSSVEADDLNGDGRPDLVLGNLGLNYKYRASAEEPFQVYSDDLNGDGSRDIVLAYYNDGTCYPVRGRQCSSQQIPEIADKFKDYNSFAGSPLDRVYDPARLDSALHLQAYTFASSVLLSRTGGGHTLVALPVEAQFSSVNGIVIGDWNGDGHKDLVLAGNLWESEVETMRNDAGIGCLLLGDGGGGFSPVPVTRSGFFAPGDVKALAGITQADGGRGVLVGNNDAPVQLFRPRSTGGLAVR